MLLTIIVVALLVALVLLSNIGMENGVRISSYYNPYDQEGLWYKGQLHCHSNQSDGSFGPEEVVSRYASLGFDFIALTDHEKITRVSGNDILILGQENGGGSTESGLTTHMCGYNISYTPSRTAPIQDRINNLTEQGGMVSLNHPNLPTVSYGTEVLENLRNYTCLEVFNANHNTTATKEWDDVLTRGKRVWGIATDDEHLPDHFGKAWVEVRMSGSLSTDNITNAIKRGSFYATQGPRIDNISFDGAFFNVSSNNADYIIFYGLDGIVLKTIFGGDARFRVDGSENYVRAEVYKDGLKAWIQPVFLEPKIVTRPSDRKLT